MDSDNPVREAVARSVVTAAERGDRLAFTSAAARYGTLAEAQQLVRDKAVLRMADRVSTLPVNGAAPRVEVRAADNETDDDGGTLFGHFTVWDSWYEVDSWFEGHFLERTVKGSTKKTLRENRDTIRALFQHGMDPLAGDKPLGPVVDLREDDVGAYYEVALLRDDDGGFVDYVASIAPGLRDGLYGASFRFRAVREDFDHEPDPSDHNPDGLPERTLREIQVMEFGPVTFPASPTATASVRSRQADAAPPAEDAATDERTPAVTAGAAPRSHLDNGRRGTPYSLTRKEKPSWLL